MPGKRHSKETIYRVMALYTITGNKSEVARTLKLSEATVRRIIKDNADNPEITELCKETKKSFVDATDEIIDSLLARIKERVKVNDPNVTLSQLTTALGTIYDKRALAKGEATENTRITVKLPEGMNDYAE